LVAIKALVVTTAYWTLALTGIIIVVGQIVLIFANLYKHWDAIVKIFKEGTWWEGAINGFKAIGRVILDSILQPMEWLWGMLAKVPGLKTMALENVAAIQGERKRIMDPITQREAIAQSVSKSESNHRYVIENQSGYNIRSSNTSIPHGVAFDLEQSGAFSS
jgi:hypothetical protein